MKRGVVFAGGEFSLPANIDDILKEQSIIVCADSGYDSAAKIGVVPDVIIGDMDSVEKNLPNGAKQIKLNINKDDTDTEACINYLIEEGYSDITLICALGGRKDHELANIMLMVYAAKRGVNLTIKSSNTEMFAVTDFLTVSGKIGDWLSLIPVFGDAEGVTLSGLKYPLENGCLSVGKTVGISNEFIKNQITIKVKKGLVIAIKTKR